MKEQERSIAPDDLERLIGQYGKLITDVTIWRTGVLDMLRLRDQVEDLARSLESKDIDIRPLRNQLTFLDAILRRRARQVVARLREHGGLSKIRQELKPDRSHWWWYLDEGLKQERIRTIREMLKWTAVLVIAIVIILFIITHVGQEQAALYRHVQQAKELYGEGKIEQALEETEKAIAALPNDPLGYIWQGVIYGHIEGQEEKAAEAFQRALSLYKDEIDFYIQRGSAYFELYELEMAYADATEARLMDPQYPEAMFLLARIYMMKNGQPPEASSPIQGDTNDARRLLKELIPLAEGKPQLQVTAKLALVELGDIYTVETTEE